MRSIVSINLSRYCTTLLFEKSLCQHCCKIFSLYLNMKAYFGLLILMLSILVDELGRNIKIEFCN